MKTRKKDYGQRVEPARKQAKTAPARKQPVSEDEASEEAEGEEVDREPDVPVMKHRRDSTGSTSSTSSSDGSASSESSISSRSSGGSFHSSSSSDTSASSSTPSNRRLLPRWTWKIYLLIGLLLGFLCTKVVMDSRRPFPQCIDDNQQLCVPRIESGICPLYWTHFPSASLVLGLPEVPFEDNDVYLFDMSHRVRNIRNRSYQHAMFPFTRKDLNAARRKSMLCWHTDKATTTLKVHPLLARAINRRIDVSYNYLDVRFACVTGEVVEDGLGRVITDEEDRQIQCLRRFDETKLAIAQVISDEIGEPLDIDRVRQSTRGIMVPNGATNTPLPLLPPFSRSCAPSNPWEAALQLYNSLIHDIPNIVVTYSFRYARIAMLKYSGHRWAAEASYQAANGDKRSNRAEEQQDTWFTDDSNVQERVRLTMAERKLSWQEKLNQAFWNRGWDL